MMSINKMGCCSIKYNERAPVWYPPITEGLVVRVYDGDTFWIISKVHGHDYQFNIRAFGYDSPEIRSKNAEEKKSALEAKKYVEDRILGKVVKIKVIERKEKYGRVLAKIYYRGECLNDEMVRIGHGYPYEGGKKR